LWVEEAFQWASGYSTPERTSVLRVARALAKGEELASVMGEKPQEVDDLDVIYIPSTQIQALKNLEYLKIFKDMAG
jgi:hypothetical protein